MGKELADRRSMARYEKSLCGAEACNQAITEVVLECPPPTNAIPDKVWTHPLLLLEQTKSVIGGGPQEKARHRRPEIRLEAETTPRAAPKVHVSPMWPPDISCADIPEEQLARTYSKSCVWDPKVNPVPPMQEMQGFGRFRRSVHADADWELNKFREDLQRLGPAVLHHLGDFEIARLKRAVMDHIRTPSHASLASRSDSEESFGGLQIRRGFNTSKTSEMTKTCKSASVSAINLSVGTTLLSPNEDAAVKWRPGSKHNSSSRIDPEHAPLSTIKEAMAVTQTKRIVPLIFNSRAVSDEVIDDDVDDDYESCEQSLTNTTVSEAGKQTTAMAAVRQHDKRFPLLQPALPNKIRAPRHHRNREYVAERMCVGQKKVAKPGMRKLSSRSTKIAINHATQREIVWPNLQKKAATEVNMEMGSEESKAPFGAFISQEAQAIMGGSAKENQATIVPPVTSRDSRMPMSNENMYPLGRRSLPTRPGNAHCRHGSCLPEAMGRKTSNTAIRVRSGNIPSFHVELVQ